MTQSPVKSQSAAPEYVFRVRGMDCTSCAQTVETGVRQLPGVDVCSLNFTTEKLRIRGDVPPETVIERIEALGYGAAVLDRDQHTGDHHQRHQQRSAQRCPLQRRRFCGIAGARESHCL